MTEIADIRELTLGRVVAGQMESVMLELNAPNAGPRRWRETVTISVAFGDTSSIKEEENSESGRRR
tara:strand:+ start:8838 stop:9035 length:198 start_codon:yes stop_codon:yes gene_type:complete